MSVYEIQSLSTKQSNKSLQIYLAGNLNLSINQLIVSCHSEAGEEE